MSISFTNARELLESRLKILEKCVDEYMDKSIFPSTVSLETETDIFLTKYEMLEDIFDEDVIRQHLYKRFQRDTTCNIIH